MSFILDALRKSENERREQAPPALAGAPQAVQSQKRTIWLPIVAIVLTLNVIVFGTIFLTRDKLPPAAATPLPTVEPAVRSLRKEVIVGTTVENPVNSSTVETSKTTSSTTPTPTAVGSTKSVTTAPKPAPMSPEMIQERLPSLGQMKASGLVSVTPLHIDMHVYAGDAAKRFVFINMKKYREGDQLSEGPTIEEITPEGIIMVQQGNRFRLDRD